MFGQDPSQIKNMMQQMGIDLEEMNATQVVIETEDGEELVFENVDVNKMQGQGQEVYQVLGSPQTRNSGTQQDGNDQQDNTVEENSGVTEEDVELVANRAGVDEETALEALEECDGDLADAIDTAS